VTIFAIGSSYPSVPSSKRYWIADTARVIGSVDLKRDTSVWFGAVIRGDNESVKIDFGTNIQENCVLHTDVGFPLRIGKNCTIGHGAIIHGCSIGDNCIIGMGAIILNGANIGSNCIVGAGALVTEGKDFCESGKLILGAPAKAVRNLKTEEIYGISDSARSYVARSIEFKENLELKN